MRKAWCILTLTAMLGASGCANYSTINAGVHEPESNNQAVMDLLAQAKQNNEYGEYALAESALERALRIEPRNPYLWFELAVVHKWQGQSSQAKSFAQRARSYASTDKMRAQIDRFIDNLVI